MPGSEHPGTRPDAGSRLLVVGASSGIGRELAIVAARRGLCVGVAARRADLLDDVVAAARAEQVRAFPCDVTDAPATTAAVHAAADWLGGLDAVVYASGTAALGPVVDSTAAGWDHVMRTNVIGAATVAAAAIPSLRDGSIGPGARGTLALLSSHSVGAPWPGLVSYAASKAALGELGIGLRVEEPRLRVVVVTVGNTLTGFADGWDQSAAGDAMARWVAEGHLRHEVLGAGDVAGRILEALLDGGPDDLRIVGAELG